MLLAHYSTLEEVKSDASMVLGIGVFDGLHLGHLDLLHKMCKRAREMAVKSAIWTFNASIPKPDFSRLMSEASFVEELEKQGVEEIHRMDFIEEVSSMSASQFLEEVLIKKLKVKAIFMGEDARLGKNRECSAEAFKSLASEIGVEVHLVPLYRLNGTVISSSKIRECIKNGDFAKAESMLGRPYEMTGSVIKDQQLARTLGFPTANVKCDGLTLPPKGVYRCEAYLPNQANSVLSIAYLGSRPTVTNATSQILEVHLKNWSGDLYGKELRVTGFKMIRTEQKFDSLEELKHQIEKDIQEIE